MSPNIHSMSFHAVDVDVSYRVPFRYAIRRQLRLKMTASPSGKTAATKAKKSQENQKKPIQSVAWPAESLARASSASLCVRCFVLLSAS